ncbi:MAG: serine/threonine protein phosphatase [Balneolaceae bacterium]|nr:MAG: serine/threonine protein phosphatase [Balneolaceae bacterium]
MERIVAIGDIHGCVKTLQALIDKLSGYKNDLHVFVGDYVDRGPDSRGVVDFLLGLREERECIFLRGNHEQMLLDAVDSGDFNSWILNGGKETLNSYGYKDDSFTFPDDHLLFYKRTTLFYETKDFFFVHAGAPPHLTLREGKQLPDAEDYFLWGRDHLNALETPWEKTVIFGHTPRSFPIRKPSMIGIDTGCVYNTVGQGKLTAVVLPDKKFIEQKSLDR